ncbi:hypothetical protein GW17_00026569 [Ensete ventricosum]|nr:hypothetical protein GW17_00026569 [Ensete ventricosum]
MQCASFQLCVGSDLYFHGSATSTSAWFYSAPKAAWLRSSVRWMRCGYRREGGAMVMDALVYSLEEQTQTPFAEGSVVAPNPPQRKPIDKTRIPASGCALLFTLNDRIVEGACRDNVGKSSSASFGESESMLIFSLPALHCRQRQKTLSRSNWFIIPASPARNILRWDASDLGDPTGQSDV